MISKLATVKAGGNTGQTENLTLPKLKMKKMHSHNS